MSDFGNYEIKPFLGRYVITFRGKPTMLIDGFTNAQAIMKILSFDCWGETYDIADNELLWRAEQK
jgi:hypothetical protein